MKTSVNICCVVIRSDVHCTDSVYSVTHLQSRVEPLPPLLDADPLPLLAQLLPLRGVQLRLELGLHIVLAATCGGGGRRLALRCR